jgi:peptide/nickel transport system permease protein
MLWYLLRRAGAALLVVVAASVVVFVALRLLPGGPALALTAETGRSPEVVAAINHEYYLDQPLPVQYARFLWLAVHGDLGRSVHTGIAVTPTIVSRIPITAELALLAVLFGVAIGIPTGVLAAVYRSSFWDYLANAIGLFGLSVPGFWLGLMLILFFAIRLHVLPSSGYVSPLQDPGGNLARMVLPAFVLGLPLAAVVFRQERSAMLDSLRADYVRTARAKGLAELRVVGVHALRNSLMTVITVVGLRLGELLGGAVVIEQIFVIPGFGYLIIQSIFERDYPVVQGVALITAVAFVLVNLLVDVSYSLVNPRIRLTGAAD